MTPAEARQSLQKTLEALYGELLDMPLIAPSGSRESRPIAPTDPSQVLAAYAERIRFCDSCVLHVGRQNLVFSRGHYQSPIAFVGDFPSAQDDQRGEPFSDEAGELLRKMIVAMKLKPENSYLTNIYKCRPPTGQEIDVSHFHACEPHLKFQFSQVRATVVVALGEMAARALSRSEAPLRVLRQQEFEWENRRVFCTYHPRELLENPARKKDAWEDLQRVMRALEEMQ
jgi:DNA polymerase